jgi:small conductance mechanosensitive channel
MGDVLTKGIDLAEWFSEHGLPVLVVIAVAILVTLGARFAVNRFRRKLEGAVSLTQEINLQRATTITHALSTAVVVGIWTVAALLLLDQVGVNLAPLIAGAGVVGVALGFGAQSIVKDTLSGFFILLENQFGVGDVVELHTTAGPVSGRVEVLTMRVTILRAFDGTLHAVPNGNIQVVSNRSRGWARAIVDVRVGYGEDVERVRQILDELFEEIRQDGSFKDWIMDGPSVLGVERMADYALEVRVTADTRPSKRPDVERQLRERISKRLDQRGIKRPLPTMAGPGTSPTS